MSDYRILIVDDLTKQLEGLKEILMCFIDRYKRRLGNAEIVIELQSNAKEVATAIRQGGFPYNIVIADVYMPKDENASTPIRT